MAGSDSTLVVHGNSETAQIVLTYDAGTEDTETSAILDVLKKHQVNATFFLTGVWAEKFPKLSQRIVSDGHEIGNHSYNHPDMCEIAHAEMLKTVEDGETAIIKVTGVNPKPLFRQPFGSFNKAVLKAVGEAGYPYSIYWDVDPIDWQLPSKQIIVNRILHKVKNGSIILMHLAGDATAEATDTAIVNLKARGFHLVTVGGLLGID